jgi:hypothetical protein
LTLDFLEKVLKADTRPINELNFEEMKAAANN